MFINLMRPNRRNEAAVLQHIDEVANAQYLAQTMGNEERGPMFSDAANKPKERLFFGFLQGGGRFIKQNERTRDRQHLSGDQTSAGNFYRLSLGKIVIARASLHVDVQLHGIDDPPRRFYHSFFIENLAEARELTFVRQENVFVDRYIRNKRLLLEDSGDAEQVRLFVIRWPDLLAPEFDTAAVRAHDS